MSMNKPNAILYPYSSESVCILEHSNMINYSIKAVVAPGKNLQNGYDLFNEDNFREDEIFMSDNYIASLDSCDTVIWLPFNYEDREYFYEVVKNNILQAITAKKNIVCLEKINADDLKFFKLASEVNNTDFQFYYYNNSGYVLSELSSLQKIDIPIITVIGISECIGKFETQLCLRQSLIQSGYKVVQIGSKSYSEFFGINPFPLFMFENKITDRDKILNFNNYIVTLVNEQRPDVIVIGLPGEMLKLNNDYVFNFGVMSYLASCAYETDFTILSIGCDEISESIIDSYKNILKYKYSMHLDCIFVSNRKINLPELLNKNLEIDVLSKNEYYSKKKTIADNSFVPVFGYDNSQKIVEYIEDVLSQEVIGI